VRGARWNPSGVAAIYAGAARATALAEADHMIEMQPVRPRAKRTMWQLDVNLARVADLTDPALLERLGLTAADLASVDFTECQRVGAAIASAGFEAMLVPSARAEGVNLVLFANALESGRAIAVKASESLA
jgi:RES domain-containing protein